MKLKRDGNREYWELSPPEVALRKGEEVDQADVTSDTEAPAIARNQRWKEVPAGGILLDPIITQTLAARGYCAFSGGMVGVSEGLMARAHELHAYFENLAPPDFGREGASGFFAGRKLMVGEIELAPEEIAGASDQFGFLGSLFKAVIQALPDYDPDMTYPIGWIFSRHDHPVERMPFHHDRVGWLVQFNIERTQGVHGGSVEIRDPKAEQIVAASSLTGFLDGYIIKDADFEHGTSGLTMDQPGDHRDVIVIRLPESEK